jgi:hypothetical protein
VPVATAGLHFLQRLLAHRSVDHLIISEPDPLSHVVERMQSANGEELLGA